MANAQTRFEPIENRLNSSHTQIAALRGTTGDVQLAQLKAALSEIVSALSDLTREVKELRTEIDKEAGRY